MSDASAALTAAWGQATSAWWSLMAGSWTAVDAVVRAILEASYQEADIIRVNEVEFDQPGSVPDVAHLGCGELVQIGAGQVPPKIDGAKGTIEAVKGPTGAALAPPKAKLKVKPAGAATGDYVAPILDTRTNPPTVVERVVVFVLGSKP